MKKALGVAALTLALLPFAAIADDRALVQRFYTELLNAPAAPELEQRARTVLADSWQTFGNNTRGNDQAYFIKALQGFGQAIPNLKWEIQEIIRDGDRYVVRGRATGTPVKPLFGTDGAGKSFDIMSIDIHTVQGGRITRSYHVEDWAGALRQLRAQ